MVSGNVIDRTFKYIFVHPKLNLARRVFNHLLIPMFINILVIMPSIEVNDTGTISQH